MNKSSTIAALGAVPFPILLVGKDEKIVYANPSALGLFGEGLTGRTFVTVIRKPAINFALDEALRQEREERVRDRLSLGAREMSVRVTVSPMPAEPGGTLPHGGALVVIEDITALEEAEAQRRDFVANVSHELRTPLTALSGFIETLLHAAKDDPVARTRFLSIMEREAARMNRLVGDLLSLSRVESEERRRPTEKVDISAVLNGAIQALAPVAEARNVTLLRDGEPGPKRVSGDPDQLTQVFSNLIENAIKYGARDAQVRVTLGSVEHEPTLRGPALRVVVADQGDGIEAIHLPRLTERFYRVDTHRSREQGGTGLGLAIVKHIVSRHRGRLKVESEKGKGSRFIVYLPLA
ncbi:sensor histidine kinase [Thioclava sp. GXIMD4215]|uniref:sensor histidine kinase n=1 Tax=Thioclava sp. GXIMD4215 TaxID=3131928 RepID=UPI00324CCB09